MDFSNPMFLANAIIFHDTMMNQINESIMQPYINSDAYFIPPAEYHYDEYNSYNECRNYTYNSRFTPIPETLETPLSLEDLSDGNVYFKAVLGLSDGKSALIASTIFNNPKTSQIASIKAILNDKIKENISNKIQLIYIVVSGNYSEEALEEFVKNIQGEVSKVDDKIIIRKGCNALK